MCRLFFADEYARRTAGLPTAAQVPDLEPAFKAAQNILPNLEARIIEFLSEWLVTFLMPAKHVLDTRAPHLCMFSKEYWFRELYLVLKLRHPLTDRSHTHESSMDRSDALHWLQAQRSIGRLERPVHHGVCPHRMILPYITACTGKASKILTPPAQWESSRFALPGLKT